MSETLALAWAWREAGRPSDALTTTCLWETPTGADCAAPIDPDTSPFFCPFHYNAVDTGHATLAEEHYQDVRARQIAEDSGHVHLA